MGIIIFGILFLFVLVAYAFMSLCVNKTFVQCVEAGPSDAITADELHRKSLCLNNKRMVDCSGNDLSPNDYFRVVVNGNCLRKKQIMNGDILIVKKYRDSDKSNLIAGRIVLLYIQDTHIYKIREIISVDGNNIKTQYYLDNGEPKESSRLHDISQVRGIVKFKL